MGNHTWSHKDLTTLSKAGATSEIARGVGLESGSSGYLRLPYGAYNASVKSIAESMSYHVCTWTIDTVERTIDEILGFGEDVPRWDQTQTAVAAFVGSGRVRARQYGEAYQ